MYTNNILIIYAFGKKNVSVSLLFGVRGLSIPWGGIPSIHPYRFPLRHGGNTSRRQQDLFG